MFHQVAFEIFNAGVNAVQPGVLLPKHLYIEEGYLFLGEKKFRIAEINNFIVIAAGKAAAAMSKIAEEQVGKLINYAICITKYNHTVPLAIFHTIEAAHPLPDINSVKAGEIVLEKLRNLNKNDIVLLLLSGGASSLLSDIPRDSTLQEIHHLSNLLINSKAGINEINTVRKHLSCIKGGNLAKAAFPSSIVTLIISDVVGDDPGTIASGPSAPDNTTFEDARNVLIKYGIWDLVAASIKQHIQKGISGDIEETPKESSSIFEKSYIKVIGSNRISLEAARLKAEQAGFSTKVLTGNLSGDTESESGKFMRCLLEYNGKKPACLLMGGETTLQVAGKGKGGRNQHFVLYAMNQLLKIKPNKISNHIIVLSAGTDGTDGPTDAAGAVFSSLKLFSELVDFEETEKFLSSFDSYNFFLHHGGLIRTGPTQTNVMDIIVGLIL
jgi:glycerate 2-kinase